MRPAGTDVHAEAARDGLVDVALDQELGDGPLHARDSAGGAAVRHFLLEGHGAVPQLLEHLDEIVDQARVAQFQGDPAVVAHRDEGHRTVEDDQAFDQLLQGADLHLARRDPFHVGERALAVPCGVLVQGPNADPAVDQRLVALQGLGEGQGGPGAARLDRQHLGMAFGRREVQGGVDLFETLQHRDGVGVGRALCADGQERLESVGEIYSAAPAVLDLAFNRMEPLSQSYGRGNRAELVRVIRVGLQKSEFKQAGGVLDLAPGDPAGAQRGRVEPRPLGTHGRHRVGMCRLCLVSLQISTPQGPEHART